MGTPRPDTPNEVVNKETKDLSAFTTIFLRATKKISRFLMSILHAHGVEALANYG